MLTGGQDEFGQQDALSAVGDGAEAGEEGAEQRLYLGQKLPVPGAKEAPEALPCGIGGPDGFIDPAEGAHGLIEAEDACLRAGG